MAREMTDEEKQEYDQLTANMEQMKLRLEELTAGPTVYGYARVSTYNQAAHGNSLEEQKRQLKAAGAEEAVQDQVVRHRPGKVQPVFGHPVLPAVQISCRRSLALSVAV